mgnify:CR=1 FL=1
MRTFLLFFTTLDLFASLHSMHILDKKTLSPITGALISNQEYSVQSDRDGKASIRALNGRIFVKAYGYKQQSIDTDVKTVLLEPFRPKALYVSFWAAGSKKYMQRILELAKNTEINTVIIDVKNEFGSLSYKTDVPLAKRIGAHKERTIFNIEAFIERLKKQNLYVIGRIVVFKDDRLAESMQKYALKDSNGTVWRNREKLAWVDPFEPKVHEYVSQIAADAAKRGFDEINFDYVRFPLKKGLVYPKVLNQENRVQAISDFLRTANRALRFHNVYTSVDTYGYVCWNKSDTNIGHTIKSLSQHSDYIAPMLYPSGFGAGILGFTDPTDHPFEIINASLNAALERAEISPSRFRPWLQSFKDYGFDRKFFRSKEISEQIKGAEDASSSGWMLWNPSSRFSAKGLQDARSPHPILPESKEEIKQMFCFRNEEKRFIP